MAIYVSLAFAIVGALGYILMSPSPPAPASDKQNRISEMFRIMYFAGLLVFIMEVGGKLATLLGH